MAISRVFTSCTLAPIVLAVLAANLAACSNSGGEQNPATGGGEAQTEGAPLIPGYTSPVPASTETVVSPAGSAPPRLTPTPPPAYPCEADASCVCADFPVRSEAERVSAKHGGNEWSGLVPDAGGVLCAALP